jgi:hypothetical protein
MLEGEQGIASQLPSPRAMGLADEKTRPSEA